jgi:hypothetical protein
MQEFLMVSYKLKLSAREGTTWHGKARQPPPPPPSSYTTTTTTIHQLATGCPTMMC